MKSLAKSQKSKRFPLFDFFDFSTFRCFRPLVFFFKFVEIFDFSSKNPLDCKLCVFFSRVFDFSRPKGMLFTGVTVTSQKGTQRLSGLCSKGIKITVTALEGWLGLRESSPNYRKFQVSEIYRNTQIRLVTHFPVFGSDFHIEDSFPNEQVKSENFPKCASSFFVYRFVTWCSCTHTHLQMCT